ncbi:MAG: DHA2 family efflux MFS transporter permease subunit [Fusobacterium sp.]|nr:DHA2 family efflux MFS transporter permease subunit [Fusobacterium sp.]
MTENQTRNPWITAIPLMLAMFIYVLDGTIANVALPHMAGTFSATRDESLWILTSYMIAGGIVIPTVGWFSKLMGRKNFFMFSIFLFALASMLCGMAKNIEFMIFARILQGFGGGGILPLGQAILLEGFPKEKRGLAMSVFGLGVIVAPIIGPVLGGWITDNWSWPWIFYINVPFGCLAVMLSKKLLYDPPYAQRQKGVKIDKMGFLTLTLWLVSLQVVLDKGNNADWFNAPWICWTFAFSVVAGICFFISQMKNKESLVDLSVFKDKNFFTGTIIQIVMQGVLYASLAILPQFLQNMLGYTAFLSGATMMPRGIGALISIALCSVLSDRIDKRILVATGLVLLGVSTFIFGSLNLQISNINIVIPNFIMGMGMGLSMIPIITISVETLSNEQMTNATGLQNLLKNIGSAIGTSIVGTMLTRFAQVHQYMLVGNLSELNNNFILRLKSMGGALMPYHAPEIANHMAESQMYRQLIQQSTLLAFMDAFRIFGILCIAVIPLVLVCKTNSHKLGKKQNQEINIGH